MAAPEDDRPETLKNRLASPRSLQEQERIRDTIPVTSELLDRADAILSQNEQHKDRMVMWIVGLSAGALVALKSIIDVFAVNLVFRWELLLLYLPFILGVLSGIAYRYVLSSVMTNRQFKLLRVQNILWSALSKTQIMQDDQEKTLKPWETNFPSLGWWEKQLVRVPMMFFGSGVLVLLEVILLAVLYQ